MNRGTYVNIHGMDVSVDWMDGIGMGGVECVGASVNGQVRECVSDIKPRMTTLSMPKLSSVASWPRSVHTRTVNG